MSLDNGYVTADYLQSMAEKMRSFKQLSYTHMAFSSGDILLDVGCGPGVDTIPLAALLRGSGKVIGIDHDAGMLDEANNAAAETPYSSFIEHRQASATELPLEDNEVNASRAERLLQVLPPELEHQVMAELLRVTRPGGRIVLADADWGSASVDFSNPELERRLMNFFAQQMRPNGFAGRHLYTLCRDYLLEDIRVEVVPMVQQRFSDTPFGDWLTNTATSEGIMSQEEARHWQDELQAREQQQRFFASANIVIVSGRKPA